MGTACFILIYIGIGIIFSKIGAVLELIFQESQDVFSLIKSKLR